jgi:hypothetical protein
MRKVLVTGLAMGIIALGSIAAPSSASALTPGQSVKSCNGWAQHSNSAVYWRTCYLIVQRAGIYKNAATLLEVKNVGGRSRVITVRNSFYKTEIPKPSYSSAWNSMTDYPAPFTLPVGKTRTIAFNTAITVPHGTFSATSGITVTGWAAKISPRTVIYRF